jgi:PAS domain S-box-containing protein
VVNAFADLTAVGLMQNRTTRNLEKNAYHLNVLMQKANDAIITVDQQGLICFWNQAAEKYFGYSADEIVGKPCTCIVPEKFVAAHREEFLRLAQTGFSRLDSHQVEIEGLHKNGAILPVELSISKWEVEEGVFFTGIIRDISHRLQMERETRKSEKRMREIFKMMEGGGGVYKAVDNGEDFVIVEYHRPYDWEDLLETDVNHTGRTLLEVFPACIEYGLLDVFHRVWKTGKPEYHPVIIYDGKDIKSWRKNYVYKLSSGEIVALYHDITERKQIETNLLESENLFRSIFETSPDAININRLDDGKFVLVNSKFLNLTGYKNHEVIGNTAPDLKLWNDSKKRTQFFNQLIEESQVYDFEAEFSTKSGETITALVSAKLLSYKNTPHLLAVTKNITSLKQTEQALLEANKKLEKRYRISSEELKKSEVKYSLLVEALLTGVYICVGEKIVFANNQFCKMFGYSEDELINSSMPDLIHPDDRDSCQLMCTAATQAYSDQGDYEIRGIRKNGDIIHLLGRTTFIYYKGQKAALGNIADISARKKAENELQKSEEELRFLSSQLISVEERERKRIAADIHDSIGQVLSAIKFSVESSLFAIAEQSYITAQEGLEKIIPLTQQSINEVRRIIMDLRPSILDDLGLIATISWFCREFESIYTDLSIEKEITVEEEDIPKPLKIVIYRILQETLNNAAKYSQTENITIKLTKTALDLELLVEDTGVGFNPDVIASEEGNRRGIGLPSIRERVFVSGGTHTISSAPGRGTRIHIIWPVTAPAAN